jgi:hypothetical protein
MKNEGIGRAQRNKTASLTLSGITITHPDRVISETGHVTKREFADQAV